MYCQVCGAKNSEEQEYCSRCHQKLLVVSGVYDLDEREAFESNPEEQFSFDEHLLERISILEEVFKRTAEAVRQMLGTVYKLEQKILVNQVGVTSLRDLLESKRLIGPEEWSELWESRMEHHLLALEKRERFAEIKDRISALYQGQESEDFHNRLEEAELALMGFDIETAVAALEEAHRLDPPNYELAFFLGETFFNEGEGEKALGYFQRVLEVKPDHYESLVYGGVSLHERGESRRAEDLLKRASGLYPEAFLPAFSLGAVYASQDRLPQAALMLERAVEHESMPQALYLLGSCYYEMGKTTPAIRQLEQATRLDPTFEEAYYLLGLAYLDRGWHRKAAKAFLQSQKLKPKTLGYRELVSFLEAGDERHVEGLAEPAAGWVSAAETSLGRGQSQHALTFYRRAVEQDNESPRLLVPYAMACLELERVDEARAVIERTLELEPRGRLRTMAYVTLIEALRSEGRYREGNRLGLELLSGSESRLGQSVAYYELACNFAEMEEDLDEALRFARRSLELSPQGLEQFPLATLGWVHFKRREFEQAVECLSRSSSIDRSAKTLVHLGLALLATGERDEAREVLAEARHLKGPGGVFESRVFESRFFESIADAARLPREVGGKARK